MKTSLVLSTYNGEKYILDQMESLKNQTHPIDEVLIFDDCSTDNTLAIVTQYIEENHLYNWKIEQNKENIGWRKNFIYGIRKCSGDIIFICDQDDIWMPEKVEQMSDIMEDTPAIGLLASAYTKFYSDGETTPSPRKISENSIENKKPKKIFLPNNILNVPYPGCTYCIRKSFFEECSSYWLETCPHDAFLWRSAAVLDCLYILEEPLILWRKYPTSSWQKERHTVSRQSERNWRLLEEAELKELQTFSQDKLCSSKTKSIIDENLKWCQLRKHFVTNRNIIDGFLLAKYRKQYLNFRQYLKDWLIAFSIYRK